MEQYICYHGTSAEVGRKIVAEKRFHPSDKENEWAGTGIYFFIDGLSKPIENARSWARYVKRVQQQTVLKATVDVEDDEIFDLHNPIYQKQFHRFREQYFVSAKARAEKERIDCDKKVFDKRKMDCTAINGLCEQMNFQIVIRDCYIRFLCSGFWKDYPASDIDNCTICCVRDQTCITKIEKP